MNAELVERSLLGLRVGDAFGERFFRPGPEDGLVEQIRARELPPPLWAWTDDTAQATVLVDQLAEFGEVRDHALSLAWARAFWADPARGYGAAARDWLGAVAVGDDPVARAKAAFAGMGSMGNGAAMRVAPLGVFFATDLDLAAAQARRSAELSHANINAVAGAVAVAVAAACVARGEAGGAWDEVLARLPDCLTRDRISAARAVPGTASVAEARRALGSGERALAHDTVPFCLWSALSAPVSTFEDAMWRTVEGLGDRDTTCAIVGGILGAAPDLPIPPDWVERTEPLPR